MPPQQGTHARMLSAPGAAQPIASVAAGWDPRAVCDEVLYEMMSCGGMMVHAGASEPSVSYAKAHLLQK
jgi:hypothetical protein